MRAFHVCEDGLLRDAHRRVRAAGCDLEMIMRVGEALNDAEVFARVFAREGAGWLFVVEEDGGELAGFVGVTFHEKDEGGGMKEEEGKKQDNSEPRSDCVLKSRPGSMFFAFWPWR